jgi:hypothetical protein
MSAELPRISAINMTPSTDEIHVWTNVSERPTGEDMDTEREKSVRYFTQKNSFYYVNSDRL